MKEVIGDPAWSSSPRKVAVEDRGKFGSGVLEEIFNIDIKAWYNCRSGRSPDPRSSDSSNGSFRDLDFLLTNAADLMGRGCTAPIFEGWIRTAEKGVGGRISGLTCIAPEMTLSRPDYSPRRLLLALFDISGQYCLRVRDPLLSNGRRCFPKLGKRRRTSDFLQAICRLLSFDAVVLFPEASSTCTRAFLELCLGWRLEIQAW
jgi:hypothetical protein